MGGRGIYGHSVKGRKANESVPLILLRLKIQDLYFFIQNLVAEPHKSLKKPYIKSFFKNMYLWGWWFLLEPRFDKQQHSSELPPSLGKRVQYPEGATGLPRAKRSDFYHSVKAARTLAPHSPCRGKIDAAPEKQTPKTNASQPIKPAVNHCCPKSYFITVTGEGRAQ